MAHKTRKQDKHLFPALCLAGEKKLQRADALPTSLRPSSWGLPFRFRARDDGKQEPRAGKAAKGVHAGLEADTHASG